MSRKWIFPLIALGLLVFAVMHALYVQRPEPEHGPPVVPSQTPFGVTVAGAGVVEPNTEASGTATIAVGSQLASAVALVHVRIGQEVTVGDPLFDLDTRQAPADLLVRKAARAAAQAQLRRLEVQPRPEEVPVSEVQVNAVEANFRPQQDQRARDQQLSGTGAVAEQDRVIHEQAFQAARAQWEMAKASLALLKAGAWEADKAIAYAAVEQARAQVVRADTTLQLLQIRAPAGGTILQVNIRPGEYVPAFGGQSLVLMGNRCEQVGFCRT